MSEPDRTGAYADLLAAVLAARSDPATQRFDAEIAAAEAAGDLAGATARSLRWWQRESVRAVGDHLAEVLPGLLAALVEAERATHEAVAESEASWRAATAGSSAPTAPPAGQHLWGSEHGTALTGPVVPGEPGGSGGSGAPGRHTDPRPGATITPITSHVPPSSTAPATTTPSQPGTDPTRPPTPSASSGAPRQRLLVAGLTVLSDGAAPGAAPVPPSL